MDMMTAVKTCFSKYVTFSGRASRSEFWWFILATMIGSIVLGLFDGLVLGMWEIQPLSTIFSLAVLLPTIAVTARRLHDTDRSGWWQLLPLAGAVVAAIGGAMFSTALMVIGGLACVALIILLIVWYATKGGAGDNRFGANPLGE